MHSFLSSALLKLMHSFLSLDGVVQPYPVAFQKEPRSQALALGDNLTLECHASVVALDDAYELPKLFWHFNSSVLAEGGNWSVNTDESIGHSILTVQSIDYEQAGDYECLVNDTEGHFITVSSKAVVQVIGNGKCTHIHTYILVCD